MNPRTIIADALGIDRSSGCRCAVCGDSPFALVGPMRSTLGPLFSSHLALFAPAVDGICAGCKGILAGRPGRVPPPLRMVSFAIDDVSAPTISTLIAADWWDRLLAGPAPEPAILSWAESKKRQHHLHARITAAGRWRIGSDHDCLEWDHDPEVVAAVRALRRAGAGKARILTGRYQPVWRAAYQRLATETDEILGPWRGSRILVFIVRVAPSDPEPSKEVEAPMPISQADETAVTILSSLARHSDRRVKDGLRFWGGQFDGRVRRFARLPLLEFASRIAVEIGASTATVGPVMDRIAQMPEGDARDCMSVIRARRAGLIALAYERLKREKNPQGNLL